VSRLRLLAVDLDGTLLRSDQTVDPDGVSRSAAILHPEASKGAALRRLCRRLGIHRNEVAAIGDDVGDVELFQAARWGVAMGNAADEVKAAADVVAPSNDEGGVGWAVRRLLSVAPTGEERTT
jgi:hypothetical protein